MNLPASESCLPEVALAELDTPALILDMEAFERNLVRMASRTRNANVRLRPHAKTHKCAAIARQQMALGAVGVCCQKLGEAESLVAHGVGDVLITNQIVDPQKLRRLCSLARQAKVAVCADSQQALALLDEIAGSGGVRMDVLVELDVGGDRCGVCSAEEVLKLAKFIARSRHLAFRGLQAYQGNVQHIRRFADRRAAARSGIRMTRHAVGFLERHGVCCDIVSGGGSGSYEFELDSQLFNEIQPGSYIFMDADYAQNEQGGPGGISTFEQSLFVYTQVISTSHDAFVVVDAGLKALSVDSGMPQVADWDGLVYFGPSDEHGKISRGPTSASLSLGTKLKLIPGHCDPTVNLYDSIVTVRHGVIESVWAVEARGPSSTLQQPA